MFSVVRTTTGITITVSDSGAGPGREMAHRHHHDLIDEQAGDDGGRGQQNVVDEAHDKGEAGMPAIFGQIGAGEQADRACPAATAHHAHHQAAEDGVRQAAGAGPAAASIWVKSVGESAAKPFSTAAPTG